MSQQNLCFAPSAAADPSPSLPALLAREGEGLPSLRAVAAHVAHAAAVGGGGHWYLSMRSLALLLGVTTDSLSRAWALAGCPPLVEIEHETRRRLAGLPAHGSPQRSAPSVNHWRAMVPSYEGDGQIVRLLTEALAADLSGFAGGGEQEVLRERARVARRSGKLNEDLFPIDPSLDPFYALDTETTGFSPAKDRVIEVALVLFEGGEPVERMSALVNPGSVSIPRVVQEMTGITPTHLKGKPTFDRLARPLWGRLCGVWLVAHNLSFDKRMLSAEFTRAGLEWPVLAGEICTQTLAKKLGQRLKKLEPLCASFGIHIESAHRALDDAEGCGRLLVAMHRQALQQQLAGMTPGGVAKVKGVTP